MHILGINCYGHDSSVSIIEDGKIIASAAEERFNRIKLSGAFPKNAIAYCLSESKLSMEDIDYITFFYNPYVCLPQWFFHSIKYPHTLTNVKNACLFGVSALKLKQEIFKSLYKGLLQERVLKPKLVEHHLAHAASAFYPSEYEKAAILSIDGIGEWCTTLLAFGENNRIIPLKRIYFPHSLGFVYASVTEYLGFEPLSDEYKVMGLASYGNPIYYKEFCKIIKLLPRGNFKVDIDYFKFHAGTFVSEKFIKMFGPKNIDTDKVIQHYADIAASLQKVLEDIVLHILEYLFSITKNNNLCLAGGVALNSVMNGRVIKEGPFKNIFVQPAANDSGTSLGGALYLYHSILGHTKRYQMKSVFLGPEFSNTQIENILSTYKLRYRHYENIELEVARLLCEGKIIGWFQGRMEVGPRALGARSILADPRRSDMKDIVNRLIKHREPFRPFAPSILKESVSDYFADCKDSPFMTFVYPIKQDKRDLIPAVTHIDGTARVQTVSQETNPKYWKLIKAFEKITNIPVILNTSFNVKGEPIVCTPDDAIRCFYSTGLDYLAIGDYLIEK